MKNGLSPSSLVNVPVGAGERSHRGSPGRLPGLKPLTRARLKAPASAAVLVTATWPNWPLAGVPPIWTLSVPAEVWVKLPATVSVLPAPTVRLPLLVKSPAVVKSAPSVRLKLPLLEVRPAMPAIVAPAPPRVMLASLVVMVVPVGNSRVAPSRAFQVPPVSVVPESWLMEVGFEVQRAGIGLDGAGVGQRAVDRQRRDVPVPAVLRIVPALSIR